MGVPMSQQELLEDQQIAYVYQQIAYVYQQSQL
jgi:hypothetical protein